MGLIKNRINKKPSKVKKKVIMIAEAVYEKWEEKPAEDVKTWTAAMIEKIKTDHPKYNYVRSAFEYTHDGNIRFFFRMKLKDYKDRVKGALSIIK